MKNLFYLFLISFAVTIVFSCAKEDEEMQLLEAPTTTVVDNLPQGVEAITDLSVRSTTIPLVDAGWDGFTVVYDCDTGFADDEWQLTITTECTDVTIGVYDCCVVGDYFEVLIDGNSIGTTPDPGYPGTVLSEGEFTVSLDPGTYLIQVRDLAFDAAPSLCAAGLSVEISLSVEDTDGDGCCNEDDAHPNSDSNETVMIDGCDSGVPNYFDPNACGSNLGDLIMDLAASAENHGDFVSAVAHLLNDGKASGWLSGSEKGAIQSCAANSSWPL